MSKTMQQNESIAYGADNAKAMKFAKRMQLQTQAQPPYL
jgi:hypothetical protein